jgi:heat shock protein HslJ
MPRSTHARGGRQLAAAAGAALLLSACGGAPSGEPGDPPAPGGSWQLVSGSGPEGAIEPLDTHPVTLSFEEEGRVGGTAACNSYGAVPRIEGERLELDQLDQTDMACDPPEVMELEAAYLSALGRADRLREEGDRLVLSGPDVELVYEPLPPVAAEALVGTDWQLDTLVEGDTASTPPAPGARLLLRPDGSVEGHTGCRAFAGEYEPREGEVRLTRLALEGDTGACPGAAAAQDGLVVSVLGDGFRAGVEGDRLTVSSRGGQTLVFRAAGRSG